MTNYLIEVDAPNAEGIAPQTWSELFAAESRITHFFEAVASLATLETVSAVDRVTTLNDYRDGITTDLTQTTDANEPQWLPTGGPGGRPAMEFARVTVSDEMTFPATMPAGDFGAVVLFHQVPGANNTQYWGTPAAATGRFGLLDLTAFGALMRVGTNGTEAIAITDHPTSGEWNVLHGSWDLSAETARVQLNYGAVVSDAQAGAVVSTGNYSLGGDGSAGTETFKVACCIVVNVDLLSGDHDDLVQLFRDYFLERFGLEFA